MDSRGWGTGEGGTEERGGEISPPQSFLKVGANGVARYAKASCPSVCNVEVSYLYRLEFLENNFTTD